MIPRGRSSRFSNAGPVRPRASGRGAARWRWALFALLLAAGGARAAVSEGPQERLQKLTRLPRISFATGLTFDFHGFRWMGQGGNLPRQAEELGKTIAQQPGDALLQLRLARLWSGVGDSVRVRAAAAQAAAKFEAQGTGESRDAAALAAYAEALQLSGDSPGAERLLRRAVDVAPEDWRGTSGLARVLAAQALAALTPVATNGRPLTVNFLTVATAQIPAAGQLETAARLLREATSAAALGVTRAPREAAPRVTRALVDTVNRLVDGWPPATDADTGGPRDVVRRLFDEVTAADLREAARLDRDQPEAWGVAAFYEVYTAALAGGMAVTDDLATLAVWPTLPESARAFVREALAQLARLGQEPGPERAAEAWAMTGTLQGLVLRDTEGAEESLRRALALEPGHRQAWETLTLLLAMNRKPERLLAVCRERVEHDPSSRNQVLLAKALEQTGRLEEMFEVTQQNQTRNREDFLANLTLGAAWLKTRRGEFAHARAFQFIAKATSLVDALPPPPTAVELFLQRGLCFALMGRIAEARESFKRLLAVAPGHSEAAEALRILDTMGE